MTGGRQDIFKSLKARGQLVEQTIEQLYSEAAGKFLADRFVYGTCPKCGYEVSQCFPSLPCPLHAVSIGHCRCHMWKGYEQGRDDKLMPSFR